MTARHFILVSVGAWSTAALFGCLLPRFWKNGYTTAKAISNVSSCELVQSISVSQFNYLVMPSAFGCSLVIISMYIYILRVARNMLSMKPLSSIPMESQVSTIQSSNALASNSGSENHAQETIEKLQEKRRTTLKQLKTFLIVVGVFFLCWFPFLVLLSLQTYGNIFTKTAFKIFKYTNYPAILNSGLNPVIYALRMKDFRQASLKLCKRIHPTP